MDRAEVDTTIRKLIEPFNRKGVGGPARLVFEDWVIHEHEIPFEFKDVPLP